MESSRFTYRMTLEKENVIISLPITTKKELINQDTVADRLLMLGMHNNLNNIRS